MYLSFVRVHDYPPPQKGRFLIFINHNLLFFAEDWPIQAILMIPDDHEGYGVRSSDNFFVNFSLGRGDKEGQKVCFCYIVANRTPKVLRNKAKHDP